MVRIRVAVGAGRGAQVLTGGARPGGSVRCDEYGKPEMFKPPSAPGFVVPRRSCDTHVHLFGPFDRYPLAKRRLYTPAPAQASDLLSILDRVGVERAVLVQPSAYAADNRCLLDACAAHPGRFRMVAVIDSDTELREFERMNALGVRGVRLNLASSGGRSGMETTRLMQEAARRIAPLGWHLQMFVDVATIGQIAPAVQTLPVDVVFDHMGMADAARGLSQPGVSALLELLAQGRTWVKLSGAYRISPDEYNNTQVAALARALVAANPDRVVWGSDWPHIGKHAHHHDESAPPVEYRQLDYGRLLAALSEWVPADDLARVLVRNPAKLYGFP